MKIFHSVDDIAEKFKHPIITIGNFDGVHLGHQEVLAKLVEKAKIQNGTSIVMLFDPHPRTFFNPDQPQKQITILERRVKLIEKLGIDVIIVQAFNKEFANISAEAFIKEMLIDKIGVKEIFVSSKFRFGKNAAGNIQLLETLSNQCGFNLDLVDNIQFRHTVVSSSFIRRSIQDGEMEIARLMLGRPYTLYGEVYPDTQRGTTLLDTPTSNIKPDNDLVPSHGIYAGSLEVDGKRHPAATYIGSRPTFGGSSVVVESHIIGFEGNLYGKTVKVELFKKIGKDKKFTHLSDLLNKIKTDIEDAKAYLMKHNKDDQLGNLDWGRSSDLIK